MAVFLRRGAVAVAGAGQLLTKLHALVAEATLMLRGRQGEQPTCTHQSRSASGLTSQEVEPGNIPVAVEDNAGTKHTPGGDTRSAEHAGSPDVNGEGDAHDEGTCMGSIPVSKFLTVVACCSLLLPLLCKIKLHSGE